MSDLPFRCRKCEKEWSGRNTAHCLRCHETFTTAVGNFDKHQDSRTGKCLDPPKAGLIPSKRAYPAWSTPPPPEGLSFLRSDA